MDKTMQVIEIQPKEIDIASFKKRTALDSDAEHLIKEDTVITTNGVPVIMYCKIKENLDALRWSVCSIPYSKSDRTGGLVTQSAIFGYKPKISMRSDFCSATAMARTYPKQHYVITEFAKNLTNYYNEHFPEVFSKHTEIVEHKVKKDWVIDGSPFTSGIVNKDNPLKYHFDAGNFKGVLSNMVAFKKNIIGGRLIIPAYNIKLEIQDGSLSVFDGQSILHGVSPFEKTNEDAYRYTIVYYTLEQMWKCETITDELIRIRKKKKEREFNRLNPEHMEKLKEIKSNIDKKVQKELVNHIKQRENNG
jgi:hypothetical protein